MGPRISLMLTTGAVLGLLGCGSSSHSSTAKSTTSTSSTGLSISSYVVRGNEETGFHPAGRPQVARSITAFESGNPSPAADEKRLRSEQFVQGATVGTSNADGGQGGSSAIEVGSAAAAAREQRASLQEATVGQGGGVSHFAVAGIPGSTGIIAKAPPGGQSTANIYFNEGRCNLWVGDETTKPGYRAAVTAAALAIYARTNGKQGPCTG